MAELAEVWVLAVVPNEERRTVAPIARLSASVNHTGAVIEAGLTATGIKYLTVGSSVGGGAAAAEGRRAIHLSGNTLSTIGTPAGIETEIDVDFAGRSSEERRARALCDSWGSGGAGTIVGAGVWETEVQHCFTVISTIAKHTATGVAVDSIEAGATIETSTVETVIDVDFTESALEPLGTDTGEVVEPVHAGATVHAGKLLTLIYHDLTGRTSVAHHTLTVVVIH